MTMPLGTHHFLEFLENSNMSFAPPYYEVNFPDPNHVLRVYSNVHENMRNREISSSYPLTKKIPTKNIDLVKSYSIFPATRPRTDLV